MMPPGPGRRRSVDAGIQRPCGLPPGFRVRIIAPSPDGRVAQLVEQGIENPRVGGSIPSPATTLDRVSERLA